MKSGLRTVLAVVCIIVIAVCAVMILQKIVGRARIDLTEHNVYTLSAGTGNIVGKVNQPVKLKLYYGRVAAMKGPEYIRFYNNYYLYVRDLLEEYVDLSGGNLTLEVIDPRPYTDEAEEAVEEGVAALPISREGDEKFFFGLVAQNELGKKEVIPFFPRDRQELVEYDISELITRLTREKKKKIGILSPLPVLGIKMTPYVMQMMQRQGQMPPPPWLIARLLRDKGYEVERVETDVRKLETIDDLDILMVVHPKGLSDRTLFVIDQFVMNGGKLMVFVDPHCDDDRQRPNMERPWERPPPLASTSSDLNDLLEKWGVRMDPGRIVVDRALAMKYEVPASPDSPVRGGYAPLLPYLNLNKKECVNAEEPVSADLSDVRMWFAGALKDVPGADTIVSPLLLTAETGKAWKPKLGPMERPFQKFYRARGRERFSRDPNPEKVAADAREGSTPVMLACRITGTFETNYPEGAPDTDNKDADGGDDEDKSTDEEKEKSLQTSEEGAQVLVFADVDMLADLLVVDYELYKHQGSFRLTGNLAAVLNALDFLGGSDDLISIRSRGRFQRPFLVVDELEKTVEKATAEEKKKIQERIKERDDELKRLAKGLNEKKVVTEENVVQMITKMADRERELKDKIREDEKELQTLKRRKREKIEALKTSLLTHNLVWAPATILLIAIALAVTRTVRARYYVSRRG